MQDYETDNYEFCDQNIAKSCFNGVKSVSDIEWICKTCHKSLLNRKPPYAYLLNCRFRRISSETIIHEFDTINRETESLLLPFMRT